MITLFIMSLSLSSIFIFLSHPLSMGITLLIQTILIAIITGLMNVNFWFSYILFLIMIGGMLVLFIYMTSIASNEKFKFSNLIFFTLTTLMMVSFLIYLFSDNLIFSMMNFSNTLGTNYSFTMNLSKFFNYPTNIILFMIIIYLFITLIAVVKITNINFGPLRQKF
uniref:NADH dehydrogenase subunit 6 n=1 Tax=Philonthus spinipes TaxID=878362 RepID=UPI001FA71612|nr:NADH dehydrogenase subunit 6 [Philonthus spinipes]ULT46834.1 NADH dehydrogenase subunit 6 [Philonthus spinipes]